MLSLLSAWFYLQLLPAGNNIGWNVRLAFLPRCWRLFPTSWVKIAWESLWRDKDSEWICNYVEWFRSVIASGVVCSTETKCFRLTMSTALLSWTTYENIDSDFCWCCFLCNARKYVILTHLPFIFPRVDHPKLFWPASVYINLCSLHPTLHVVPPLIHCQVQMTNIPFVSNIFKFKYSPIYLHSFMDSELVA